MNNHVSIETPVSSRLQNLAGPLLSSKALKRLEGISFLGILSPRYAALSKSPIYKRRSLRDASIQEDGSRAAHSVGVAELAVEICSKLNFSIEQQRYAAAWGLLHDLGNWPLSHTVQHAFTELLGVQTKTVREWLITNDGRAPEKYFVVNSLLDCKIDPERLLALFRKVPDQELQPVSDLFQSKLTPDMLEGVWRSGRAFGISNFSPNDFREAWYLDLANEVVMNSDHFDDALAFWRTKREIYSRFFSSKSSVTFESNWSLAVMAYFQDSGLTLLESLELDEDDLVKKIAGNFNIETVRLHRWKPPIRQRIKRPYPKSLTIHLLNNVLVEEYVEADTLNED